MKTKANQWQNRQLTMENISYNTTPENTACRKPGVCLAKAQDETACLQYTVAVSCYISRLSMTHRVQILRGPLGGIFFLLKAAHGSVIVFHRVQFQTFFGGGCHRDPLPLEVYTHGRRNSPDLSLSAWAR